MGEVTCGPMVIDGDCGGYIAGGDPATFYPAMWGWAIRTFSPSKILDVGCGEGHSLNWFLDNGMDAIGIDGSRIACAASPLVTLWNAAEGAFVADGVDLVWCCEMVEHVDESHLSSLMATLCQGRVLMMTHAGQGQGGHHHVNCRPGSYWIDAADKHGMAIDWESTYQSREVAESDCVGWPINHWTRSGLVFRSHR